ncbi:hypothetical protein GCM10007989_27540 [Devosia pacifica]|uniref:ABC transporter n=1 Tax=Devosia pacifica TaxID=1335967 RepID=A0A918S8M8_9HYPH|nr:DUF808 domain-containing protein [Devosia pacifica]GHA30304.1 hypothetical protein GCM10007989_27540 [Devosia pacifica]
MSVGLLALLDDVAALAKVAAASLDDIAGQAAKAGAKAAGAVIDDAAVAPSYVHGFSADRELPIIGKIAIGSVRNKLVILLPIALLLSLFLPGFISPLLMLGGAYLAFEGAEKVSESLFPHHSEAHVGKEALAVSPAALEEEKVAGAIQTDFILSAEIMTITLAEIPAGDFITQLLVLALVAIAITVAVYGSVALIVKADDFGVFMARNALTGFGRAFGRWLVRAMPIFMRALTVVGTAAMLWVGGGIIVHGLASFGFAGIEHAIETLEHSAADAVPQAASIVAWVTGAVASGLLALAIGAALIPLAKYVLIPLIDRMKGVFGAG